jgi:type I restriction enzyme S subunit
MYDLNIWQILKWVNRHHLQITQLKVKEFLFYKVVPNLEKNILSQKFSKEGDILFSVRAPVGDLNISNHVFGIGRGLCAISVNSEVSKGFIWWSLHNAKEQLKLVETGSTYAAVSTEDVGNIRILDLPTGRQEKIAYYLDKESTYIDNLIAEKENLILLLNEKRQSLIYQAVLKGLYSKCKFKNSGIIWLGEIPSHWSIERSKWLFTERNDRSETGNEEMLSVSHITGVTPRSEKNVNMFEAETNEGYKKCFSGDLVINTLWAWMGAMGVAHIEAYIQVISIL